MRHGRPTVALLGDAATVLRRLLAAIPQHNRKRGDFRDTIAQLKAQTRLAFSKLQPQMAYLEAIRAELPEDGIFVDEFTQVGYVSRLAFPVYAPRTLPDTGVSRRPRHGFPDGARRQAGTTRRCGGFCERRWRVHVQRTGAGDGGAVPHSCG